MSMSCPYIPIPEITSGTTTLLRVTTHKVVQQKLSNRNGCPMKFCALINWLQYYLLTVVFSRAKLRIKSQLSAFPGQERTTVEFTPRVKPSTTGQPCESEKGMLYTGTLSVTVSGARCLPWASEKAKALLQDKTINPEVKLLENYCRNPDADDEGVWCVIDEPPYFEYCDLHYCGKKPSLV